MRKTLLYLRHTILDGPDGSPPPPMDCVADFRNPGPEGLQLAENTGKRMAESGTMPSHLFDGFLTRTTKTGLAFCRGLGYVPQLHPAIPEIWDDSVYRGIDTPTYRAMVNKGTTKMEAVLRLCCQEEVIRFSQHALQGIVRMLNSMPNSGDRGVAFGHDPIILLAALALFESQESYSREVGVTKLGEMEGLIFTEQWRSGGISAQPYKP